jgi:hypothetical protein
MYRVNGSKYKSLAYFPYLNKYKEAYKITLLSVYPSILLCVCPSESVTVQLPVYLLCLCIPLNFC